MRTFFITDSKFVRVKLVPKNYQSYLLLQAVVEKKNGEFFWEAKYLDVYVIMPDEVKEIGAYTDETFKKHKFSNLFPTEVHHTNMDDLNLGKVIYDTYQNYLGIATKIAEAKKHAETVNIWEKALLKEIQEANELTIEIDDEEE